MGVDLAGAGGLSGRERFACRKNRPWPQRVIPAKAGIQEPLPQKASSAWIPSFAGTTEEPFTALRAEEKHFPFLPSASLSFPLEGFFLPFYPFRKAFAFLTPPSKSLIFLRWIARFPQIGGYQRVKILLSFPETH
jgi:hypothetical protein